MASLVELQATFPRITKPIRPLAGVAVLFVPDKFFRPKPALFAQRQNQFQNKCVAFAIFRLFLDVQDESSRRLEDAEELFAARQKPFDVFFGRNTAIGVFAAVGIRRRGDNQIKRVVGKIRQDIQAIAVFDFCCEIFHFAELSPTFHRTQVVSASRVAGFQICLNDSRAVRFFLNAQSHENRTVQKIVRPNF